MEFSNHVLEIHRNLMAADAPRRCMMNQRLAEVRILAARKMRYMTHQVMSLIPVERPGLGTMAVDDFGRLY